MRYVDKRLSKWYFVTYIQCTEGRSNVWFFIHFYYSQIMRRFGRSFYRFLMHIQTFFNDYVTTIIRLLFIQSHSKIIQSTQSKCCETKITSCKCSSPSGICVPSSIWDSLRWTRDIPWGKLLLRTCFHNGLVTSYKHANNNFHKVLSSE